MKDLINTEVLELLSKVAQSVDNSNKLDKILGILFPFVGLKKFAVDTYVKDIQESNLSPEAKMMAIYHTKKTFKELKNQYAIAQIAKIAAKEGTDFSESSKVDDEWLSRYMDAAKFVSDEEAQVLWGNVLAGEFESPGSAPPSVIRILSELTRKYAAIFSELCSLRLKLFEDDGNDIAIVDYEIPFISELSGHPYLESCGITFAAIQEMEQLGLIYQNDIGGYGEKISKKEYPSVHLVSEKCVLTIKDYPDYNFPLGKVLLTDAGAYLARFIPRKQNEEHILAVKRYLEKNGAKCAPTPEMIIEVAEGTGTDKEYSFSRISPESQQT